MLYIVEPTNYRAGLLTVEKNASSSCSEVRNQKGIRTLLGARPLRRFAIMNAAPETVPIVDHDLMMRNLSLHDPLTAS